MQEGVSHDECIDDALAALTSVDKTEFKLEIMLMKSRRVRREYVEVRELISVATTKRHDLVTNNKYVASKDSDVKPEHLSFVVANPLKARIDTRPRGRNKIEE